MFHLLSRNQQSHFSIFTNPRNLIYNLQFLISLQTPHLRSIPTTPLSTSTTSSIQLAKKLQLESTENQNLVLNLLKSYGITDTHMKELVLKVPKILKCDTEMTLKPKMEFLHSLGVSGPDIAEIITHDTAFIHRNLEETIIPASNMLRRYFTSPGNFLLALKQLCKFYNHLSESNIALLCDCGVQQSDIILMLKFFPRAFSRDHSEFKEIVQEVKDMGFDPASTNFCYAVRTMGAQSKLAWERKWETYRRLGFSDEEVFFMFKKKPFCLMSSEEKIQKSVDFFTKKLKLKLTDIVVRPNLISYSLEQRIIPRVNVMEILNTKGFDMKMDAPALSNMFAMSEEVFFSRFVKKHLQRIPEVGNAYQNRIASKVEDGLKDLR